MNYYEVNFDGIAGPTHNYSGLSYGNLASMKHKSVTSNPKEAALQCLNKMKYLTEFGLVQGILPPHERPNLEMLRQIGFKGKPVDIIAKAYKEVPEIFFSSCSSSNMWTANAAVITPSTDTSDKHVHITPANLPMEFHRSMEYETTTRVLKAIFNDPIYFKHHSPLPSGPFFCDEGAANHTRFCKEYGQMGVHLFVYGKYGFKRSAIEPTVYPARQTFEASEAIVRQHEIPTDYFIYAQQNPNAIDAGVFHNDVISVGNCNVFLYHEKAFVNTSSVVSEIEEKVNKYCNCPMIFIKASDNDLSLDDVVRSYLFNSQIINIEDHMMAIIAPTECQKIKQVRSFLDSIVSDASNPIKEIHYINLQESMQNGGGPACLRLRVVLNQNEVKAVNPYVLFSEQLYVKLSDWVHKHYRDRLTPKDLADPQLVYESQAALDEITQILNLGSIYSFQKTFSTKESVLYPSK
ncbi:MAG: N-succinylarginine dihydrolase [Chlamydiota bacterium]|nr:N-succinylarginine dihydrolase [Chlamydiota bacterium]